MIEKLQNAGLTVTESRIYLFLLEYKEAKAGEICKKLNLHTSHIYDILNKLQEKGLVSFKLINNVKLYYPADPQILLERFSQREQELKEQKENMTKFISELKEISSETPAQYHFKYFEGSQGVKSMFFEFIEGWTKDSTVFVFSAPIAYKKWNAFLLEYFHPARVAKNIKLKLIIPQSLRVEGEQREAFPLTHVKYALDEYPSEFAVCGEYVYFLSQGEKPYAIMYKDENMAKSQQMIFMQLWKNCK